MKLTKISFLFFCVYLFFLPSKLNAQTDKDSLVYYYNLANTPKNPDETTKAFLFYSRLVKKNVKDGNLEMAINNYWQLAIIEFDLGLIHESEQSATEALKLLEGSSFSRTFEDTSRYGLYNLLGRVYSILGDSKKALKNYYLVRDNFKEPKYINIALNNIAVVYRNEKKYNRALSIFEEIHEFNVISKDSSKIARSYNNMGVTQGNLSHPEALNNLNKSLALRLKLDNREELFSSYYSLSNYYLENNNLVLAKKHALDALALSTEVNNKQLKITALSLLAAADDDYYITEYKRLTDSVAVVKQSIQNKYASQKYDLRKQINITEQQVVEAQKYKQQSIISFLIGILITIASICIYFILRIRHKNNNIVQVYQTETRISKKVHDEVANDIYFVMSKLENEHFDHDEILDDLEELYLKTRDISKENSDINTKDNFTETIKFLLLNYKTNEIEVITKDINTIQWESFSENKKKTLYRVLQELMTNMKKHSKATIVVIKFEQTNKNLSVIYSDNGVGASIIKSNGLLNAENRIKTINGTISFESKATKGFKSIIRL